MIGKIMYLCRKYRDEIIFGKLLENFLLQMYLSNAENAIKKRCLNVSQTPLIS